MAMESAVTTKGLGLRRWAAAAGVMARLSTSRVPTICAASVTVTASTKRKMMPSSPVRTPRARATSASTEAKSSGRQMTVRTTATAIAMRPSRRIWLELMPKMLPKRMFSASLAYPW
jgi:hypothetical protein